MLHDEVVRLASIIGADEKMLPSFGQFEEEAKPYILQDGIERPTYHFIVKERGIKLEHKTTLNKDQILYWIFSYVVSEITARPVEPRPRDEDPRRRLFARREEMMGKLNVDWQERKKEEHSNILYSHPFDDNVSKRVDLIVELRAGGMSAEQAYMMGVEKYPLPATPQ